MKQISGARRNVVVSALLAAVLLGACSRDDPSQLIASARAYQAKGEHPAAIIQLKNAVQKQPSNGEARLLLGQSSLAVDDPLSAEKELRKALEFGQPKEVVVPLLVGAMYEVGEIDKLVAEFGTVQLADPKADAELRARVGDAQVRMRRAADAQASYRKALDADPANPRAQMGEIRLLAVDGKLQDALTAADRVTTANPTLAEPWMLKSELQFALGDRAAARASLLRATEVNPSLLQPRLDLIALLANENDFEGAAKQLQAAQALKTNDLRLQYLDALVTLGRKDTARARQLSADVLKKAPEHVPSLVLAGAIELQDKNYAAAESHLQKAVLLAPQHGGARQLLARSYMAANQPARALDAVQPLVARGQRADPGTLMLAGEAALAAGDPRQASGYFEEAAKSKSQESAARVRLGQIALARGDVEGGIKTLEAAVASDGATGQAELALIAGYLRQGDTGKALQAAQELVKRTPTAASYQVLGAVQLARKDPAAARAAYSKALELDKAYLPAVAGLARLDLADGKTGEARGRFEALLKQDPKNELALLGLAEVMVRTQAPTAEVAAVLQRAVAARPESATARVALVNVYLQAKDTRAALTAAQEASAALGQDPRVIEALGRAQIAAGETNQAIETFQRLAVAEPQSVSPLQRLAALYMQQKQPEKAVEALLRAQKIAPADANVARDLVVTYLSQGRPEDALKQARAVQVASPKSAAGFILEGDVYASARNWAPAERAFREGLKAEPTSPILAVKLHGVLRAADKAGEADAFARKRLQEQPDDLVFRTYLAEQMLSARDYKNAAAQYQVILAKQPDNAVALNNIAWAMGQLGDPKALAYGERALKAAPNSPLVLDTVGVLLMQQGNAAKAVEYLSRAVELAPDRHDIRLNYAKALLKTGRKEDAAKQLAQLQGVTQEFPGKSELPALLKQI